MKLPTTLLYRVLLNEGLQVNVAVKRDFVEIQSRFEHEGMGFLTITLPVLSDALEKGLASGLLTPLMFNGFKPFKRGGSLPALLSGFFKRVFDLDGSLKDCPCIDSIRAIRQVSRLFKKVELPCSDARVFRAYERYKSNDESIYGTGDWCATRVELLALTCGYLWSDLESLSGDLYCHPGVFGSGASSERVSFNERHSIKRWPKRGSESFPSSFHTSNNEDDYESFAGLVEDDIENELPVRVVQVPKTLKTPRTISVEPSYMMLRQQSIAKPLMDYLESNRFPHNSIRFSSQVENQDLARIGSVDGSLATIDLKDASDLVGNDLVNLIFSCCPTFLGFIQDSRSLTAQLPNNLFKSDNVISLRKFASQGSALCFPIEAMTFFSIVMMSLVRQSGRRLSTGLLRSLSAQVAVYGDDIIVPADTAPGVMEDLEAFGLKVNQNKSYHTGFFRESCGGDYYKGVCVTPIYVRHWDNTGNIREASYIAAYVSLSNQFYSKGLWHASQFVRDFIDSKKFGPLARSTYSLGVLTYRSVIFDTALRWNAGLCGYRVKGPSLKPSRRPDQVQDLRGAMLLKFSSSNLSERRHDNRRAWSLKLPGLHFGSGTYDTNPIPSLGGAQWTPLGLEKDSFGARDRLKHLDPSFKIEFDTSVAPYSVNVKSRWTPTKVGIIF